MDAEVARDDSDAVAAYVDSLDEAVASDSRVLIEMMSGISAHQPRLWNVGTIGFDSYHYRYESGREGDGHAIGFYPRRGKITVYLMDGTERHAQMLEGLGKHTTSRVCIYIKRLSDVDLAALEGVVRASYEYVKSQDGNMHRV